MSQTARRWRYIKRSWVQMPAQSGEGWLACCICHKYQHINHNQHRLDQGRQARAVAAQIHTYTHTDSEPAYDVGFQKWAVEPVKIVLWRISELGSLEPSTRILGGGWHAVDNLEFYCELWGGRRKSRSKKHKRVFLSS